MSHDVLEPQLTHEQINALPYDQRKALTDRLYMERGIALPPPSDRPIGDCTTLEILAHLADAGGGSRGLEMGGLGVDIVGPRGRAR